jgi:hypothetical protein
VNEHASVLFYMARRAASAANTSWQPPSEGFCHPLTAALAHRHARNAHGVLFVTFSNRDSSEFAANWARQLRAIGLDGLIGVYEPMPEEHARDVWRARSSFFCCGGQLMRRNGQAGRWAEVAPLLRLGLHVLISDAVRLAPHPHPHPHPNTTPLRVLISDAVRRERLRRTARSQAARRAARPRPHARAAASRRTSRGFAIRGPTSAR